MNLQPLIMRWTKGWIDSIVLCGGGLSYGWAFNTRRSSASPSSSALPAEPYLSWLSSSNSPLGLWLSHLARKRQPKPALSFTEEKGIPYVSSLERTCWTLTTGSNDFFCQRRCPLLGGRLALFCLKKVNKLWRPYPRWQKYHFDSLKLFHHYVLLSCQGLSHSSE